MGVKKEISELMQDYGGYLTSDQVKTVIEEATKSSLIDKLFIELLWTTGARVSELLFLTPSRCDFRRGAVILPTEKLRKKTKDPKKKLPKPKDRILDIPKESMDDLKLYMTKVPMKPDDKFFDFSRHVGYRKVRLFCHRAGIMKIGIKSPHPHHFRHSHAIYLVQNSVPLPVIQYRLGHSSLTTTSFYLQFSAKDTRAELEKVWKREKEKIKPQEDPNATADAIIKAIKP